MPVTIEAIVIKKVPVREYDLSVTLYSRELGKFSAVAKSALKPHSVQAAQLDIGNCIHCELVHGRGAPIVTAAQATKCFSGAKSSAVRWAAAQFFLQVIDVAVYDEQPDDALFACLYETLCRFDEVPDAEALSILRTRQDSMLNALGYGALFASAALSPRSNRTEIDDAYERITQRKLGTLDLFYDLVRR